MAAMTRKEAREELFRLLFETEFRKDEDPRDIYTIAVEARQIRENDYVKECYFGICEHLEEIDEIFAAHSNGWKPSRISATSRSVIRLCTYEMMFREDIPAAVSLNEAIELVKLYDDPKARAFVNGVLNGIKNTLTAGKGEE